MKSSSHPFRAGSEVLLLRWIPGDSRITHEQRETSLQRPV